MVASHDKGSPPRAAGYHRRGHRTSGPVDRDAVETLAEEGEPMGEAGDGRVLRHLEKQLDYLHASARSYDTKAQIASVGYLLTVGVVRLGFEARPGGWAWPGAHAAAFGLLVVVLPVAFFVCGWRPCPPTAPDRPPSR